MKAFLRKLCIRSAGLLPVAGSDALATDNIFQIALKMDMPSNITT